MRKFEYKNDKVLIFRGINKFDAELSEEHLKSLTEFAFKNLQSILKKVISVESHTDGIFGSATFNIKRYESDRELAIFIEVKSEANRKSGCIVTSLEDELKESA